MKKQPYDLRKHVEVAVELSLRLITAVTVVNTTNSIDEYTVKEAKEDIDKGNVVKSLGTSRRNKY